MEFDISSVETATMVFVGTLLFALVIVAFVAAAAFVAIVLLGVGRLAWFVIAGTLLALVHGINHAWDRALHHAATSELPADLSGQSSPSTGSYPRVALWDS
jgi:fatty acid desaturase